MKQINKYIQERLHINKDIKSNIYNYQPKTKNELKELVYRLIKERGYEADLNDIDTSEITDMSRLFYESTFNFNGNISNWDVSNVESMYMMFYNSKFTCENGDISNWNVSNVKDMNRMFLGSALEKNPPKWYKE